MTIIRPNSYNSLLDQFSNDPDAYAKPNHNGQITREQASEIFDLIQWIPDLYFCTPENGCFQRNALIRILLNELNIKSSTALTKPDKDVEIEIKGQKIYWGCHHVPVIQPSDEFNKLVFDPTLAHEPMELDKWLEKLGFSPSDIDIIPGLAWQAKQTFQNL